jgi:transglutaminase-like putative cysteine protease
MRAQVVSIPSGDAGTYAVLAKMRALVRGSLTQPLVRQAAASIVDGMPGMSSSLQIRAIRNWIEDHVTFLRDPRGVEALHTPELMVRTILTRGALAVDCDDVAMLAAALGMSIGLRARFVVVGFHSPSAPYRHVWTDLGDPSGKGWLDLDTTRPSQSIVTAMIARRLVQEV